MYGRVVLTEHLAVDGWTLRKAHWRPTIPFRQARFRFDAERDGRRVSGRARLGGYWSGPVFSKSVELDWTTTRRRMRSTGDRMPHQWRLHAGQHAPPDTDEQYVPIRIGRRRGNPGSIGGARRYRVGASRRAARRCCSARRTAWTEKGSAQHGEELGEPLEPERHGKPVPVEDGLAVGTYSGDRRSF